MIKNDFNVIVRRAVKEDKAEIISFTRNTWAWGDYIPRVLDYWLREKDGLLLVADIKSKPVGLLHIKFLPDNSAWLEGLRVHPFYRRRGIALKLNQYAFRIIKEEGINVVRLVIESDNEASINLANKLGFTKVSEWASMEFQQLEFTNMLINCEKRIKVDDIWSELKRSQIYELSSGLIPIGWRWIKVNKEVLEVVISRKKWLRGVICGGTLGLFMNINYGVVISFSNAHNKEEILRLFNGLRSVIEIRENGIFELQLPKGHELIGELKDIASDFTSYFIFEKRL